MEREKPFLYIDTNFAPDEALLAYMAFKSYDFELLGMSTSSGMMSSKLAAENIVGLSASEDLYLSVAAGEDFSDHHLLEKKIFETSRDYVEEMPAYENIIDKASDCGKLDIITTGNLTNIARALEEAPGIEDFISHIFILGGHTSGQAEEIFALDPKAIDKILNTSIDVFILPEDVYKNIVLTDEILKKLRDKDENLDKILDEFEKLPEEARSLGASLILYLTQAPEAFIFEENGYKVDSQEDPGALIRTESRKKNYMANRVNEESFYDFLLGSLS